MAVYLDYAGGYAAGGQAAQQAQDNWRKNVAMNALTKKYGPATGAPVVAQQMQAYLQATQMDPLKLRGKRLQNTAQSTLNDFNVANNPIKLRGGRLRNSAQSTLNAFNVANNPTRLAQGKANLNTTTIANAFSVDNNPTRLAQGKANLNTTAIANAFANANNPQRVKYAALVNQGKAVDNAFAVANNPNKLKKAQQDNTAQANKTVADAAMGVLDRQSKSQGIAFAAANNPQLLQQQDLSNKASSQVVKANEVLAADAQRQKGIRGAYTLASALGTAVANGMPPPQAWDAVAPQVAKMTGATPDEMQKSKDAFLADPVGFVSRVKSEAAAAVQGPMTRKEALAQVKATTTSATDVLKQKQAQASLVKAQITNIDSLRKAQQMATSVEVFTSRIEQTPVLVDNLLKSIDGLTGNPALNKALAKWWDGSGPSVFEVQKEALKASIALSDMATLRQQGAFAGRVTNYEMQVMGDAYAALDLAKSPKQLRKAVLRIKALMPKYIAYGQGATNAAKETLRRVESLMPAAPPPTQAGQTQAGQPQTQQEVVDLAHQAIANGADPQAVAARMSQGGYDPSALFAGPQQQGGQ